MLASRDDILKDLNGLIKRADREFMSFSKGKCKVLQMGQNNATQPYSWATTA